MLVETDISEFKILSCATWEEIFSHNRYWYHFCEKAS